MHLDQTSLITIGIATKERSLVLNKTLEYIHDFGLSHLPVIILDDGAKVPINPPALKLFKSGLLIRNEISEGQAKGRNRITRLCRTPYMLQLDDDSYPISGDIDKLLIFAKQKKNWLAIGLPLDEPSRKRVFPTGEFSKDLKLRSFVGCAVLINVEIFNSLGGYADWIGRTCEEEELSLRGYISGVSILGNGNLRIRHDVSDENRNLKQIAIRSVSNWIKIYIRFAPVEKLYLKFIKLLIASLYLSFKFRTADIFIRYAVSICSVESWSSRRAMKRKLWEIVNSYPHALDFYN